MKVTAKELESVEYLFDLSRNMDWHNDEHVEIRNEKLVEVRDLARQLDKLDLEDLSSTRQGMVMAASRTFEHIQELEIKLDCSGWSDEDMVTQVAVLHEVLTLLVVAYLAI